MMICAWVEYWWKDDMRVEYWVELWLTLEYWWSEGICILVVECCACL